MNLKEGKDNRLNRYGLSLLFFCILMACSTSYNPDKSVFYDFDEKGMVPNYEYVFLLSDDLKEDVSLNDYSLNLIIRYSDLCHLKNLPLKLESYSIEKDSIVSKNLNVPLFNKDGLTNGKGNLGIYEVDLPLIDHIKIDDSFFISLSTHSNNNTGILSMGIIYKKE